VLTLDPQTGEMFLPLKFLGGSTYEYPIGHNQLQNIQRTASCRVAKLCENRLRDIEKSVDGKKILKITGVSRI